MSEINKAIARVMLEVGSVKKAGTNSFHNYKYAKAEDVIHALQRAMADAGLIIYQNEKSVEYICGDTIMRATYEFALAHTGGEERPPIIRSGMAVAKNAKGGFDDKAINKCSTAALKYFLIAQFKIATGDYADADKDDGADPPANGARSISARAKATGPTLVSDTTLNGDFGEPGDGEEYDDAEARRAYLAACTAIINATSKTRAEVLEWWKAEAQPRRDFGLSQLETNMLKSLIAEKFPEKVPA
jgi:hypothetical protein